MATPEEIAAAINQIDEKKKKLKKAFDDLQAHRSLLSPSFNLSWSEINSHFSSLQSSLCNRFRLLHPTANCSVETSKAETTVKWPELRKFCENMDGNGLGKFMIDNSKNRMLMNLELDSAIRCASNPAALVLDAIQGSYHCSPSSSSAKQIEGRRIFVCLLEALIEIKPNLTNVLRERARTLAYDWKKNIGNKPSDALGFLLLIVAFELGSLFNIEELVGYVFLISTYKQATLVCKKIGLDRKRIRNMIQKFLDTGKFVAAIRFVYEFEMTGEYKPVSILKTSLKNVREAAMRVLADGNYSVKAQNEAADKELSALRAVIKVVKERNLESEFVQERLEESVKELVNQNAERRRGTTKSLTSGKPQKPKQQVDQKRPRVTAYETTKPATPSNPQKPKQQVNNKLPRAACIETTESVNPGNPQKLQKQVDKKRPRVACNETTKSATPGNLQKPRKQVDQKGPRVEDDDEITDYIPMPKIPQQSLLPDPNYNSQVSPMPPIPQEPVLPDPNYNLQVNPFGVFNSTLPGVSAPYSNPFADNPLAALLYIGLAASVPAQAPQPAYYDQQNGFGGSNMPTQYHPPNYK